MACEFCGQPALFLPLKLDDARALGKKMAWLCPTHFERGAQRHLDSLPLASDNQGGDGNVTLPDGT